MSLKDWAPPSFLPQSTRHGGITGRANERRMADAIGGVASFRTVIRNHPDGSATMLRTRNGFPEYTTTNTRPPQPFSAAFVAIATMTAKFSDFYMTSGAYAFGALGGINTTDPLLTIEPVTYKSGAVTVGEAPLAATYERPPPANGDVSKLYNQTRTPGGLNGPKQAMYDSRPSEFSGIMRRCIQARYGSGNTSQDMVRDEDSSLGSVTVGNTFGRTTAILKFGLKYFFVAISSGGGGMYGRWWPLLFPPEYEAMLLHGTDAWETLALSHAYVLPHMEGDLGNFDIAYGSPIYYGWSFSLTTNKAVCCINDYLDYPYDRRMYYLMNLTFSYDVLTDVMTCDYALDETVDGWIAPIIAPIWSPSGGETIWYNKRALCPAPTTSQDFPVHAFYVGDEKNIVRWKYSAEVKPAFDLTNFNSRVNDADWDNCVLGEGGYNSVVTDYSGSVATHGFAIDGVVETSASVFNESDKTGRWTYKHELTHDKDGGVSFQTDCAYRFFFNPDSYTEWNPKIPPWAGYKFLRGNNPAPPRTGNHYSTGIQEGARTGSWLDATIIRDTGSSSHLSALVIPAKDCSSVYIGTKKSMNVQRSTTLINGASTTTSKIGEHWLYERRDPVTGVFIEMVDGGEWIPDMRRQLCLGTNGGGASGGTTSTVTVNTTDVRYSIRLLHADDVTVGSTDSEIFHPGALHETLSQQVQVLSSSLYNEMRYNDRTLIGTASTTGGYPLDITLFVGAS